MLGHGLVTFWSVADRLFGNVACVWNVRCQQFATALRNGRRTRAALAIGRRWAARVTGAPGTPPSAPIGPAAVPCCASRRAALAPAPSVRTCPLQTGPRNFGRRAARHAVGESINHALVTRATLSDPLKMCRPFHLSMRTSTNKKTRFEVVLRR